jgi:uncharacterized protein (TIGR00299 family) protein
MFLGMLVDAGVRPRDLERELGRLPVRGWHLRIRRVRRGAVECARVEVVVRGRQPHERRAAEILRMLRASRIEPRARDRALAVFRALAEAEAQVHGISPRHVHFHEVGAVDAIVDIAGTCIGLEMLAVDEVFCSPVPVASGEICMEHGLLPNPGPATMRLLRGFPLRPLALDREIVTPTGAALLAGLVRSPGRMPAMTLERIGYGAGGWDLAERPNFARIWIGDCVESEETDVVWVVETTLDDATGEQIGHLLEQLPSAGALDAWVAHATGKKSRPALVVSVLAPPDRLREVERALLAHTTTFGVRRHLVERTKLARAWTTVRTPYGSVRVKTGAPDGIAKSHVEYEDARCAARAHRVPLAQVIRAAEQAAAARRRPRA